MKKAQNTCEIVLNLVNNLVNSSRSQKQIEVDEDSVEVRSLVWKIVSLHSQTAINKRLDLRLDFAPGLPKYLVTDPSILTQVLMNVIVFAVKSGELK